MSAPGHSVTFTGSFRCHEPDTAWCRLVVVGAGEPPPEDPDACWFTVLASGFDLWDIYDGPNIDPLGAYSGPVIFTRNDVDDLTWRWAST
jgi:hypothetical protein